MARLAFVVFRAGGGLGLERGFGALVWHQFNGTGKGLECFRASLMVSDGASMGRDRWGGRDREKERGTDQIQSLQKRMFPLSGCRLEVERG